MNIRKNWYIIATVAVCVAVLAVFALATGFFTRSTTDGMLKVGFVYSEDASTPYTYNFMLGERALKEAFGSKVTVLSETNVNAAGAEEPIRELVRKGCRIIFINLDAPIVPTLAAEYPAVQFCQISMPDIGIEGYTENYHTFNGELYQARYAAGVIAGAKLQNMIDEKQITKEEAKVGYVAANHTPEVVSGYTAFLMGIRSIAPDVVLRVRETGAWSNYTREKAVTRDLINEGCIIIAQHTNTMAPSIACEEAAAAGIRVYHIGYHQSMLDISPNTALAAIRTNWAPYMISATEAVMKHESIEKNVAGHLHGNDISAGFDQDWVQVLDLNSYLAAPGTEDKLNRAIDGLKKGRIAVFKGNYTGKTPIDREHPEIPPKTIDLSAEFRENADSSLPSFGYILDDVIVIEN